MAVAASHGSFAPINGLSPELLRIIFLYMSGFGQELYAIPQPSLGVNVVVVSGSQYGWIAVSQVCKQWRAIALDYPDLWNRLKLQDTSHEWLAVLLERSKGAPLDISLDLHASSPYYMTPKQALGDVLKARAAVVRSLSISVMCRDPGPVLKLLDRKRLRPEYLDLSVACPLSLPTLEAVHQLFRRVPTSRLRRLKVQSLALQSFAPAFSQLTHLTIDDKSGWCPTEPRIEFEEILDALTSMKSLEELDIRPHQPFIPSTSDLPTTSAPIVLPRLRHLSIEACVLDMTCLLDNLDAPSLSRLCIDVVGDCELDALRGQLLPAIVTKTARLQPFLSLFLDIGHTSTLRIRAYTHTHSVTFMNDCIVAWRGLSNAPQAPFELCLTSHEGSHDLAIESCQLLPLDNLHSLLVHGHSFASSAWATLLARTENITQLLFASHVDAKNQEALDGRLSEALMRKADSDADGVEPHPFILPRLQTLALTGLDFARPNIRAPDLVDRLVTCLRRRREGGAGIETLHIARATKLSASRVTALTKLTDVHWEVVAGPEP